MSDLITIYKNDNYLKNEKNFNKAIVFDLDETIGNFTDLYILWVGITKFLVINKNIDLFELFNKLLDLFPEFIRPNIIQIFSFILKKKQKKQIRGLYIYTNNQCMDDKWIKYISNYFDYKLKYESFFDKIIYAFKIDGKILQLERTTCKKKLNDFINCTLIPNSSKICFIDNTFYQQMIDDKVYYIQPVSYYHNLSENTVLKRFCSSEIGKFVSLNSSVKDNYFKHIVDWFFVNKNSLRIPKNILPNKTYQEISKKILYHIKEFLLLNNKNSKTKKKIYKINNFTRKNSYNDLLS